MKRLFDIFFAFLLMVLSLPLMAFIIALMIFRENGSVFYISERMKTPKQPFNLIKFRTMTTVPNDQNTGITGGDKMDRITPFGHVLRRYRIDEIPQLINILKGDMSFVGPRPPLRRYTDAFPELYGRVLQSRPGVTGLASLHFYRHEGRLTAAATTPEETETIYIARCIPRKATLDLIYQRHASVRYDVLILLQTMRKVAGR